MRARSRWGSSLVAFLAILGVQIGTAERVLAETDGCAELASPLAPRLRAECDAEIAAGAKRLMAESDSRYQPPPRRTNPDFVRAVAITTVSVAIAGVHVGLSSHYRNSETNLGGLFAYQGALGGAMFIGGLGAVSVLRQNVTLPELAAAVILVPIGMLGAGIGGGIGGYQLGEPPGNGRVAVSVVSQAFILSTVLGFSWLGVSRY